MSPTHLGETMRRALVTSLARPTDPGTSHEAARAVRSLEGVRWAVYRQLSIRPMADHELVAKLSYLGVTPQRIRTARAELVKSALVMADENQSRNTPLGNRAQVWRLP